MRRPLRYELTQDPALASVSLPTRYSGHAAFIAVLAVLLTARPTSARAADARGPDASTPDGPHAAPPEVQADAQSPRDLDAAVPPELQLPKLVQFVHADYPAEARTAGVEAMVALRLTIDAEGRVSDAEVLQPVGRGFDDAARAAALRFRFEPARRNGQPIPSRIRYEFRFEISKSGAAAPPAFAEAKTATGEAPQAAAAEGSVSAGLPAKPSPPPRPEPVLDVTIRGTTAAQRLRESAEAVTLVETERAQRESADLGEVVARNVGVSIRRSGGLGSEARFSLNGLSGEQVRFFLDGVPLDVAGFGLGLQNVPLAFVERVEIYRGVVPIRLGADALGGTVNLVSEETPIGTHATASAQLGSFETSRLSAAVRHRHDPTGLYAAADTFFDRALNDYPIDVEISDEQGTISDARVHRFHDRYRAYGGRAEVGFVNRPWARRLSLRVHGTRVDKELQHNLVMKVPYGDARYWDVTRGAVVHYSQPRLFGSALGANAIVAASRRAIDFKDVSPWTYDWFGRRTLGRPGEIGFEPTDERVWQHTGFGRLDLTWTPSAAHVLRLGVSPTFVGRGGRDRTVTMGRDPLSADRDYFTLVSGLEYEARLFDRRLESTSFVKSYALDTTSEESLPGGRFRRLEEKSHTLGFGEALRVRVTSWLAAKLSYERATRLPSPHELFGDGVFVKPNLRLVPERSHNANAAVVFDLRRTVTGSYWAEVNGFARHAQHLIRLLGVAQDMSWRNVHTARSQGVEVSGRWTSPGAHLVLDGNVTWQSLRNDSDEGTYKDFKGDRLPNEPWLFANASARVQRTGISSARDELSLAYYLRYVKGFYRGWESLGLRDLKDGVPSQTTHSTALTYLARGALTQTWTAEIQNLADTRTYDLFGVQRPGRAFYVKVTLEY